MIYYIPAFKSYRLDLFFLNVIISPETNKVGLKYVYARSY